MMTYYLSITMMEFETKYYKIIFLTCDKLLRGMSSDPSCISVHVLRYDLYQLIEAE